MQPQPRRFQFQFSNHHHSSSRSSSLHDSRIGLPFIITIRRSLLSYHHLCTVICSYASHSVSAYRTKVLHFEQDDYQSRGGRSSQLFTFNLNEFCRSLAGKIRTPTTKTLSLISTLIYTYHFSPFFSDSLSTTSSSSKTFATPHFVHFETTASLSSSPHQVDTFAPFVIRKPHLSGSAYVNTPEEEVVPPLIRVPRKDEEAQAPEEEAFDSEGNISSEESEASTIVGAGGDGEQQLSSSASSSNDEGGVAFEPKTEEESGSSSSGFMSAASSDRGAEDHLQEMSSFQEDPKMEQDTEEEEGEKTDEEGEEEEEHSKAQVEQPPSSPNRKGTSSLAAASSAVRFNNDVPLGDQLSNCYYITADWIDVPGFPTGVGVILTESTNRNFVPFSNNKSCRGTLPFNTNNNGNEGEEEDCITLDDCFELFSEPEVLGQQNCWKCPACRAPRAATKQLSFNLRRLPPILVVQLKRFKMGGSMIHRRKLGQLVRFPLRGLDLRKTRGKAAVDLCGELSPEEERDLPPPLYDLYAVVNHMGEAFMGHYTAYARAFDGQMGKLWIEYFYCSLYLHF